jgi:serine protease
VDGDRRYAYLQGTSMAAPQVTAAAALVRALNPDLSAPEVIRILKDTARRGAAGWTPDLGWGILDAGAALDAAAALDRRPPETRLHGPRHGRAGRVLRVRWTGGDSAPPGVAVAGLARVTLYAGRAGHRIHRVRRVVHHRRLRFRPRFAARYRLYTLAVDAQGNAETRPSHVVRVRVRRATSRPRG